MGATISLSFDWLSIHDLSFGKPFFDFTICYIEVSVGATISLSFDYFAILVYSFENTFFVLFSFFFNMELVW